MLPADVGPGHPRQGEFPETDPSRMQLWRETTRDVADQFEDVFVVDLASWMATQDDAALRPDGVHFDMATSIAAAEGLLPPLVDLVGPPNGEISTSGGILLAGEQLARLLASELLESGDPATWGDLTYAHLPTLPRDEASRRSWETRLAAVNPAVVVVILEHWEAILAAADRESASYEPIAGEFIKHLIDSAELVVIGVPASFGDSTVDASMSQLESLLLRLSSQEPSVEVIRLSGGDGLELEENAVRVGPGWASDVANSLQRVLGAAQ